MGITVYAAVIYRDNPERNEQLGRTESARHCGIPVCHHGNAGAVEESKLRFHGDRRSGLFFHQTDLCGTDAHFCGSRWPASRGIHGSTVIDCKSHDRRGSHTVLFADDRYLLYLFQNPVQPLLCFRIYSVFSVPSVDCHMDSGRFE